MALFCHHNNIAFVKDLRIARLLGLAPPCINYLVLKITQIPFPWFLNCMSKQESLTISSGTVLRTRPMFLCSTSSHTIHSHTAYLPVSDTPIPSHLLPFPLVVSFARNIPSSSSCDGFILILQLSAQVSSSRSYTRLHLPAYPLILTMPV